MGEQFPKCRKCQKLCCPEDPLCYQCQNSEGRTKCVDCGDSTNRYGTSRESGLSIALCFECFMAREVDLVLNCNYKNIGTYRDDKPGDSRCRR